MNIQRIIEIKNQQQSELNALIKGIKTPGKSQDTLNDFLQNLGITPSEETRFLAYSKIVNLKGEPLLEYFEKYNYPDIAGRQDAAYIWNKKFHFKKYKALLKMISKEKIISDFYMELLEQVHIIGSLFCDFYLVWNHHIFNIINPSLETSIGDNTEKIITYLREQSLLDLGHDGEEADRSYSVLIQSDEGYTKKSYTDAFPKEIGAIITGLNNAQQALSLLDDLEYNKKNEYIEYFKSLVLAFSETNTDALVGKWTDVDTKWMAIDTPFQIVHPIEYYEDKYRKAVSPEWDIRIDDTLTMTSHALPEIKKMYEYIYDDLGRETYAQSYKFSLDTLNDTKLHICSTIACYGSRMTGIYSAQVIPNDPLVTAQHGKKIFAVPNFILESQRNAPVMQLNYEFFEISVLKKYKNFLLGDDQTFYKVYDIETIGHEFGHTLWLDTNTEVRMNKKTGVFKDLEEFKATSGGLVSFFLSEDPSLIHDVLTTHIMRCIGLMKYKKVIDVIPYYAEALIHLDLLYTSGVISYKDMKLRVNYDIEIYNKYKTLYLSTYTNLALCYLKQEDAGDFLFHYMVLDGKYYIAKKKELRNILDIYFHQYEMIGNKIYLENISELS